MNKGLETLFITVKNSVAIGIGIQRIGFKVDLVTVLKSVIIGVNLERISYVSVDLLAVIKSVAVRIIIIPLSSYLILLQICKSGLLNILIAVKDAVVIGIGLCWICSKR